MMLRFFVLSFTGRAEPYSAPKLGATSPTQSAATAFRLTTNAKSDIQGPFIGNHTVVVKIHRGRRSTPLLSCHTSVRLLSGAKLIEYY